MPSRSRYAGWLLALLLVPVASTTALAAQGVNFSWGRCFGEGVGTQNRNFACNTNAGTQVMTGSFILASDMPQVVGTEMTLQLAAASQVYPAWWDLKTCRPTSLSVNFVADAADVVCADWAQGLAIGGLGGNCVFWSQCGGQPSATNVVLIKIVDAVAPANAQDLAGGAEYFDFNIVVDNARTVGSSGCPGCTVPVCIVLNTIDVVQKGNVHHRLSTAAIPGSNFITWQGGGSPSTPQGNGCPAATPVQRSTWGSVKSLYR
jgi:hypothetical protein